MVTKEEVEFGVTGGEDTGKEPESGKVESDLSVELLPTAEKAGENLAPVEVERIKH